MTETPTGKPGLAKKKTTQKPYKRKVQIKKNMVDDILSKLDSGKTIDDIVKEYKVSKGSLQKMLNILRMTKWKEKSEIDSPPKGYMYPVSVKEVCESYMYDLDFICE